MRAPSLARTAHTGILVLLIAVSSTWCLSAAQQAQSDEGLAAGGGGVGAAGGSAPLPLNGAALSQLVSAVVPGSTAPGVGPLQLLNGPGSSLPSSPPVLPQQQAQLLQQQLTQALPPLQQQQQQQQQASPALNALPLVRSLGNGGSAAAAARLLENGPAVAARRLLPPVGGSPAPNTAEAGAATGSGAGSSSSSSSSGAGQQSPTPSGAPSSSAIDALGRMFARGTGSTGSGSGSGGGSSSGVGIGGGMGALMGGNRPQASAAPGLSSALGSMASRVLPSAVQNPSAGRDALASAAAVLQPVAAAIAPVTSRAASVTGALSPVTQGVAPAPAQPSSSISMGSSPASSSGGITTGGDNSGASSSSGSSSSSSSGGSTNPPSAAPGPAPALATSPAAPPAAASPPQLAPQAAPRPAPAPPPAAPTPSAPAPAPAPSAAGSLFSGLLPGGSREGSGGGGGAPAPRGIARTGSLSLIQRVLNSSTSAGLAALGIDYSYTRLEALTSPLLGATGPPVGPAAATQDGPSGKQQQQTAAARGSEDSSQQAQAQAQQAGSDAKPPATSSPPQQQPQQQQQPKEPEAPLPGLQAVESLARLGQAAETNKSSNAQEQSQHNKQRDQQQRQQQQEQPQQQQKEVPPPMVQLQQRPPAAVQGSKRGKKSSSALASPTPAPVTPAVAMAVRQAQRNAGMEAFVVCSLRLWNVTEFPRIARDFRAGAMSALIASTSGLALSQADVLTAANVSLGLRIEGADLAANPAATEEGLRAAFADLALGYDPGLIRVEPSPPPDAAPPAAAVALGSPAGGTRRLLQAAAAVDGDSPAAGWGDAVYASYTGLSPSSVAMLTKAFQLGCGTIAVGQPLPANCTAALAQQLSEAGVPLDPARLTATITGAPTTALSVIVAAGFTRAQMEAGATDRLVKWLSDWSNIRTALGAAGLTSSVGSGSAGAAAAWLQPPEVIYSAAAAPAAAQQARRGASTAIAAGLAVPLGACVLALSGLVGSMVVRKRRQRVNSDCAAAPSDSSEAPRRQARASAAVAAPRGKRRYTAPVLPITANAAQQVEEMAATQLRAAGTAAASGRASGSSAGAAASPSAQPVRSRGGWSAVATAAAAEAFHPDPGVFLDDDDGAAGVSGSLARVSASDASDDGAPPTDLRPRLRSIGDSVASAARFEAEGLQDGAASDYAASDRGLDSDDEAEAGWGSDEAAPHPPTQQALSTVVNSATPFAYDLAAIASAIGADPPPHANAAPALRPPAGLGPRLSSAGLGSLGLASAGRSGSAGLPSESSAFSPSASLGLSASIQLAPDGSWVAPGLAESLLLASGNGSSSHAAIGGAGSSGTCGPPGRAK